MECSLELLQRGLIVSLQDLGAAGLTSSASEMASKGEVGLDVDVTLVPLREAGLEPFEVMVSESQERMLCVVEPSRVDEVLAICEKWEVYGAPIGVVTDTRRFRVFEAGTLVGDMPVPALVDDCPLYDLEPAKPTEPLYSAPPKRLADDATPGQVLRTLLGSPNLADRTPLPAVRPDRAVAHGASPRHCGRRRARNPDADDTLAPGDLSSGALGAAPGSGGATAPDGTPRPGIAASIDGSGRRVAADPYQGTVWNVLECAANLATVGARPLGLTNNLNFGNPEKPAIAWQLSESIRGLGDACRGMDVAVVGGNVFALQRGHHRPRSTPRPSSAWSASCPMRARPRPWALPTRATASRSWAAPARSWR